MTVPATLELASELRRLAAAGVALANGDRRVAALVPALRASGARAAVFSDLATRAVALIEAPRDRVAADFLALTVLVNAVLRTQGRTAIEGELAPLPASSTRPRPLTVRTLESLGAGADGGRMEAIGEAFERDLFGDARLAPFALEALHSDNAEIANLAASRMLPAYGPGIVPLLTASLDPTGKRAAARTIEAIRGADPAAGAAVARAILDPESEPVAGLRRGGGEASDEARAAALGCLEDTDADRALLRESLAAKRKPLRVAALRRLLEHGDAEARAHAIALLGGSATKAREAAEALPELSDPDVADVADVADAVVARASEAADRLDAGAGKSPGATDAAAALALLDLLARSAPDEVRFEAAMRLCAHAPALGLDGRAPHHPIGTRVGEYLITHCPPDRHAELTALLLAWKPHSASIGLIRRFGTTRTLALLRDAGDEHLARGMDGARSLLAGTAYTEPFPDVPTPPVRDWDAGWLELALEHDFLPLAQALAELAPPRVVESVLARDRVPFDWALLALTVDPGCAARLPADRLTGTKVRVDAVRAIREALATGDRGAALDTVERFIGGRTWIDGVRELHDRLLRDAGPPDESSDRSTPSEPTP